MHKARAFFFVRAGVCCLRVLVAAVIPLAILTLTLGPTAVLADPLFAAKTDYGTGTNPYSVAIGT